VCSSDLGIEQGDALEIGVNNLCERLLMKNVSKGKEVALRLSLSEREKGEIKAGGKLAAIKAKQK
jgi:hypothetical protein